MVAACSSFITHKFFASCFALRLMYDEQLVTGTLNITGDGELGDGDSRSRYNVRKASGNFIPRPMSTLGQ
jgi:hypothetical protein